ncbi:MAG TPA: hypothetical protein VJO35_11755 [Terriglobales bacterium]|nr:hypothetical protein [Terriglobales bacterium]
MSTTLTTKAIPEVGSRFKPRMVSAFYLLTFLTGAFFLLTGGTLSSVIDLTVAMFYITATMLFYALNKDAHELNRH